MITKLFLVDTHGPTAQEFQHLKAVRLNRESEIRDALGLYATYSLWITPSKPAMDLLLKALPSCPMKDQRLLYLEPARADAQELMHSHFRFVVSAKEGIRLLPSAELIEVLGSDNRADLLIAGKVTSQGILLYRGNLEPIIVPLEWFVSRSGLVKANFSKLEITDYGQTVRLGKYEASTDAILYEFDKDYRARAKQRMLKEDSSIGGAIRRLRLQKGLRQSDFANVTEKEIGRIERGEVKPRQKTLEEIASQIGIPVDQIQTW